VLRVRHRERRAVKIFRHTFSRKLSQKN